MTAASQLYCDASCFGRKARLTPVLLSLTIRTSLTIWMSNKACTHVKRGLDQLESRKLDLEGRLFAQKAWDECRALNFRQHRCHFSCAPPILGLFVGCHDHALSVLVSMPHPLLRRPRCIMATSANEAVQPQCISTLRAYKVASMQAVTHLMPLLATQRDRQKAQRVI